MEHEPKLSDGFPWLVARWSNCRLKREREDTAKRLAIIEEEIDRRLGNGRGGLK